jgi:RHS repeat-associated protein
MSSIIRVFAFNLRFPGQIFDGQVGVHYNGFRDFDPATGRYVESDPVGLMGGVNTYLYVLNDPLAFFDSTGLLCTYSQSSGLMTCADAITGQVYEHCKGYSGRGAGRNNPDMQWLSGDVDKPFQTLMSHVIDAGAITRGYYAIGAPIHKAHMAPPVLPVTPVPFNDIEGRSGGFLIHGDNSSHTASNGCIILGPDCRRQIKPGELLRVVW